MPIAVTCDGTSCCDILFNVASAAAKPRPSVQSVLETNDSCAACIVSAFPITAAIGTPLPRALAKTAMSADAIAKVRPATMKTEAGGDLVEDQRDLVMVGEFADGFEEAGRGIERRASVP